MAQFQLNQNLFISKSQHNDLVKYIKERLDYAKPIHDAFVTRLSAIDKEYAGYIRLDDDDKKRKNDTLQGFGPKPYDVNIQFAKAQIDEAVTFLMEVFYPQEGPYVPIASKEMQPVAKGLSVLMNQHAKKFHHFEELEKFCQNSLKYNLGLLGFEWTEIRGNKIKAAPGRASVEPNQLLFHGNSIFAYDIYNTMYDPCVSITKLHSDGEWFSIQEIVSNYRVKRLIEAGKLYNLNPEDFSQKQNETVKAKNFPYYKQRPDIVGDAIQTSTYQSGWKSFLSADLISDENGKKRLTEFEIIRIWLPANEFGLSENKNQFELWEIILESAQTIVFAKQLTAAHGLLPIFAGVPWNSDFKQDEQSFAEMLLPYQRFASYQLNIHQKAQRKALYGLTIFNEQLLGALKNSDMIAGAIPMSSSMMQNLSVNDLVKQFTDVPDTQNTLVDIDRMEQLMQKLLPTNKAQQVAGLERATMYQAAAMVQASDRRNLKIAKLLNSQALEPLRDALVYNIKENQDQIAMIDPQGNEVEVDMAKIRDLDFEFEISAALRGSDKLLIIEFMKELMFAILQSPRAGQDIDIVAFMDYMTSVMGDYTDLRQFKFKNEFDKLTPEQKQIAFQLLQQAMMQQANAKGENQGQNQIEGGQPM